MHDPERHRLVRRLFAAARALDPGPRAAFLEQECRDAADLRDEVEDLLALDRPSGCGTGDPLVQQVADAAGQIPQRATRSHPTRIDHYTILGVLGEGGMGIVYHAEQTEPLRREVALKLTRDSADGAGVVARFEAERQTLASLDHPNIAKLFDAGADQHGRPFFVMELVRGRPITEYCDAKALTLRDRVELFVDVCRAVRHAHRKGVIHRDLKPSNVLVTESGERPVIKVIDFSIAKVLGTAPLGTAFRTRTGQLVGTLEYMSPEQARGDIRQIDVRTDVYSLGVMLYELVAGRLPLDLQALPLHEVVRRITEEPAAALHSTTTTTGRIDADLQTVIGTCLNKEAGRRYRSAIELVEDIERYLDGRPILARRPSTLYRMQKLILRHKLPFAFVSTVFVLLVAYGATASIQSARARTEAHKAQRVSGLLQEILASARPDRLGRDVTVREILDETTPLLEVQLAQEPEVLATVRHVLAASYEGLGETSRALALAEQALAARIDLRGPRHLETLETQVLIAKLYVDAGRPEEAERLQEQTLEALRTAAGREHPLTLRAQAQRVLRLEHVGRFEEGLQLGRETVEIQRRVLGEDHPDTLEATRTIGVILNELQRYDEACQLYEQVLASQRRTLGDDHPETLATAQRMAEALFNCDRPDDAESLFGETIERRRRVLGPDHPDTLNSIHMLGWAVGSRDKWREAGLLWKEAYEGRLRVFGADHMSTLGSRANVALVFGVLGMPDRAEVELRAISAAYERTLGRDHPRVYFNQMELAQAIVQQGRLDDAEALMLEALKPAKPDDDDRGWLDTRLALGEVYRLMGRSNDADELIDRVIDGRTRTLGARHDETLAARTLKIRSLLDQGRHHEARTAATELLAVRVAEHGETDGRTADVLWLLSEACVGLGQRDEARGHLDRALATSVGLFGQDSADLAYATARYRATLGDLGGAIESLRLAVERGFYQVHRLSADRHGPLRALRDDPRFHALVRDLIAANRALVAH